MITGTEAVAIATRRFNQVDRALSSLTDKEIDDDRKRIVLSLYENARLVLTDIKEASERFR